MHLLNQISQKIGSSLLMLMLLSACLNSPQKKQSIKSDETISKDKTKKSDSDDLFLFEDSCACSFECLAKIRTSANRYDLIYAGKGWDSKSESCVWGWGELINNAVPPDTFTHDFRVHLLDLESLSGDLDSGFLESALFKDNLIVSYARWGANPKRFCRFDPNHTGKYSKPAHWVD